jgi:hypothetical protein
MNVLDQTSDPGFSNLRVIVERFPNLRTFAKTANLDPGEFEKLSVDSFAWPAKRKFPMHTPQHTAISIAYSKLAAEIPRGVQAQLEKAASLHGLTPEVFTEAAVEKVASTAEYLLPEKRRFKVASSGDVTAVEQAFLTQFPKMSMEDRAEAGMNLVKVAEQHDVQLHPSTHKLAGFTMTSTRAFRDWMGARKEAALKVQSPLASAFMKLAEAYKDVPEFIENRGDQLKLAAAVSRLDKEAGITGFYGTKLPTPIQTVFNTDLRRKDFVKVSSALMNKELLAQLPLSFWQDTLGADIAAEIAPDGEVNVELLEQIIPTLPADLKLALETQLAAYNK